MKTAYIATNGCQGAEVQVHQYMNTFSRQGYLLTSRVEEADLIVMDLCSFTAVAAQESLDLVSKINDKRKSSSEFVVTGCYLGINPGTIEEIVPQAKLMSKEQLRNISGNTINNPIIPGYIDEQGVLKLKIEDGCAGKCTYCAIPNGIGRRYSYPLNRVISTVQDYVLDHPGATVKFVGEDIGFYGLDHHDGTTISTLLEKVGELPGDFNVRVDVMNPWWVLRFNNLVDVFAQGIEKKRIVPYLGIPFQSGSNRILHSMKRLYTRENFEDIVDTLHAKIPIIKLSSEVIVGFPGETEDDFKQTFDVIEKYNFDLCGIWGYTDLPGTEASLMDNKVEPAVIKERMEILVGLMITKQQHKYGAGSLEELCVILGQKKERLPINTNGKDLFMEVKI